MYKEEQYILTSSAIPIVDRNLYTGIGRFSYINMKPLFLYESKEFNSEISTTYFELLFENSVNRDLSIYLDTIDAKLMYYTDRLGLECDM